MAESATRGAPRPIWRPGSLASLLRAASRPLRWSSGALLLATALHVDRLPPWCTIAVLGLAAWRIAAETRPRILPGTPLRSAIAVVLLLAVGGQFSGVSGLAAGTSLLACMGGLKLLETRARRDHYVVLGVALFLILAACLDRQGLPRLPLYIGAVWLSCAALAVAGSPEAPLAGRAALGLAGRALGWSLPLALLLFVFFPRVQGQVWALPGTGAGVTGLGNEMSPGAISELTTSYDPAFRARFAGRPPPARALYWRGPVLQNFDGYTWKREPRSIYRQAPLRYLGAPFRYRITLEPHQRNWWYALDMPSGSPEREVVFTWDYMLATRRPVRQAVSYELASHLEVRATEPLSPLQRRLALQLPPGRNPRSLALGRELRAASADEAAFVAALLERFRSGGFAYTLTPPKLDLDSVDDFMFNTRRGFCGHYASAFVSLARAGGVPARVVTGYQGGEWNPIGAYYIVRQSDAHAWAEVWLEGRGWTRVDPTGVVAPERLDRGMVATLPDAISTTDRMLREIGWLADARLGWDTINTWWKDRVIEFDLRAQFALLSRLGFESPGLAQLGAIVAGGLLAWLSWLLLRLGRMAPPRDADPLQRAWRRLCARLAALGLARHVAEGPLDYARRIRAERPRLDPQVSEAIEAYAKLRYGPAPAATEVVELARRLTRLSLRELT